ncbi:MAG: hypothetical protein Q4F65_06965 [Propionibacteriaceae bacterium]|nr:hypothetical protein [Propionibacteriaceae bacterium]
MNAEAPTQVRYPWRAAIRTVLAHLLAAAVVLPIAWGIVVDELQTAGIVLPEGVGSTVAWLLGVLVAVSGIVTRVMAIPQVSSALTRLGVGPVPDEQHQS